jgi:hypothetical protein
MAFGHGIHGCLGAPLTRLEAGIALADFLERVKGFELATDGPWEPHQALSVHGPSRLPIRFTPGRRGREPSLTRPQPPPQLVVFRQRPAHHPRPSCLVLLK